MSYADIAAKGPKQSDDEKIPPQIPEIMHDDSGVHSLDSLKSDNDHVQSLSSHTSSYADQQLAEERAQEARQQATEAADEATKEAKDFLQRAEKDAERLEKEGEKKFDSFKSQAKEVKGQVGKSLSADKEKAKKSAKEAEEWAEKNKNNPVVIGNAVVITALGVLLGAGAYRMHKANTLTWNVAGAWAGAVGLFAVGDYYVSQYFFKKYPPKN
ncbi:hypothetical protein PRZ48_004074 [Zasmidium cellare]|uniref:Mitochondrial outer membrane protein OM14 C-terminal domain-containing protein n=1 Tax=Zasmidium cellare TaxID=395010 RepID=A0ABR0EWU9_ZASCE|nr:hypothetical protein PRZ48_004074 [Zasmidium cellare]